MQNEIQKNKKENKKGYAIIEVLFYIALFALLSLLVIDSLISMTRAFRQTTASADLVQSASILERVSREIRQAYSINYINTGDLRLNTRDESGQVKVVKFWFSGSNLSLFENDILIGTLNTPNIEVDSLFFTSITTLQGEAVKISFSVRSRRDPMNRIEDFYDTVVLRGGYEN